ncbi:hypothetical protein EDC96DRAFT_581287 [Choanephora cucurbitarum]|nr:hypothetical protein EDC96DRAFT_581287 [Choanephora cucurbitarum]
MKNLEDQIDASKHQKNDEIQDMEGITSTIPYPTKFSKVSGKLVKRKSLAEDVKDALASRSDEVVKAVYNNKPPTWKHVPTSTRSKMYLQATKLIAKGHGVNMKDVRTTGLSNHWFLVGIKVDSTLFVVPLSKIEASMTMTRITEIQRMKARVKEADEETGSESENDEVAVSQSQKRKSRQVSDETSRSHKKVIQ